MSVLDNGGFIGRTADYSATNFYQGVGTIPRGEQAFTSTGTTSWTVPSGVISISVVSVGGGGGSAGSGSNVGGAGGGGGGLSYVNNISVTPGESLTITVGSGGSGGSSVGGAGSAGGSSSVKRSSTSLCEASGGAGGGAGSSASGGSGGIPVVGNGGNGGSGGNAGNNGAGGSGGGAGGYSGNGGNGVSGNSGGVGGAGTGGAGGGGGSDAGGGGGGGGVGILGEGSSGLGGSSAGGGGGGGSGGANGDNDDANGLSTGQNGGAYGGGGGSQEDDTTSTGGNGGQGAVRIIWGGDRAFPSTNTNDGQGSTTGTTNLNKKNTGLWNLDSIFISKAPITVFTDTFETFTGWTTVGSGVVSQSSTQAYAGTYSAYKTTNGDPNGAYKLLDSTVNREYTLEVWIFSEEPRAGGTADRISIVDASGNGYGFITQGGIIRAERRDAYAATAIGTDTSWTRPANAWYRIVFEAKSDNTFTIAVYNSSGTLLGSHTSNSDTTHSGPFDRVAILGGNDYYVDNLVVKRTFT